MLSDETSQARGGREPDASSTAPLGRKPLLRWLASYGTFGIPQAAAPIAFALLAVPLTGRAEDGAAMVLAMTLAQVVGAIPVSRLGSRWNAVGYLRLLVAVRTLALGLVALLASVHAPFVLLLVAAAAAGLVNGAAYGYQRVILNHLVEPQGLPRALGIAATLNEVSFAASPVIASALGSVSPLLAVCTLVFLGAGPLLCVPSVPEATAPEATGSGFALLTGPIVRWLWCGAAGAAAVAGVEVGAVSLAMSFGLEPGMGAVFTVALCLASITGGVLVSMRNRISEDGEVLAYLALTAVGSAFVAVGSSLVLTLVGAVLVGFFLPALATHYSLVLDRLSPAHRRAEVFALLRTANALGIIAVSGLLALAGLTAALLGGVVFMVTATAVIALDLVVRRRRANDRQPPGGCA